MKTCLLCGNDVEEDEGIVTTEGLYSPCCGGPMKLLTYPVAGAA